MVEFSDPLIIYLLKQLGFNNGMAFRGIQTNFVSVDQIIEEMVKFVKTSDSKQLEQIGVKEGNRDNFELNLGQKACVFGTVEMITDRVCKEFVDESDDQVPSPASSSKQSIPDPVFDLTNLQQIVDVKLSEGLKNHGYDIRHFNLLGSSTETFPYKVYVECPNCMKRIAINITADNKRTRKVANFRRYSFINHYLKCMGDQQIVSYDIKMEDIDPIG